MQKRANFTLFQFVSLVFRLKISALNPEITHFLAPKNKLRIVMSSLNFLIKFILKLFKDLYSKIEKYTAPI